MPTEINAEHKVPSVLIISNTEKFTKQKYDGPLEYEVTQDFNLWTKKQADLYCFITEPYDFLNNKCLNTLVDKIISNDLNYFCGIYTDLLIFHKNIPIYRPQLSYKNGLKINSPFIIKKNITPIFKHDNPKTILLSGFISLSEISIPYHLAEPLFKISNE